MGEQREEQGRTATVLLAVGAMAWVFALSLARDIDIIPLLASVPDPWHGVLATPFRAPCLPLALAGTAGFGMVFLVTELPDRLKVYGSLFAFTAPMYACIRLVAEAFILNGI